MTICLGFHAGIQPQEMGDNLPFISSGLFKGAAHDSVKILGQIKNILKFFYRKGLRLDVVTISLRLAPARF